MGGLFCMAMAVVLGLAHRYFAIDYMTTMIEHLRKGYDDLSDWRLAASTFLIVAAPLFLAAGTCLIFFAVFGLLRVMPLPS
jgi:hypothetical protein